MSVKLLQKSELVNLKAKARDIEVQEGAKLATRVDGLRKLQAKTEQDFEAYKTSTLTAINEEIIKATKEKERLVGENRQLEARNASMLPEIGIKRSELAQFEKSLTSWEKKLEKREENAGLMEIDVFEAKEKAENASIRAENDERISANLLKQANEKKELAQRALLSARTIQATAEKEKKEIETLLTLRENNIMSHEAIILHEKQENENKRKELSILEIQLKDQRATLARSIERIKQNRLA